MEIDSLNYIFDDLRKAKQEDEIACLKKAADIAEEVYGETLKFINEGKTETTLEVFRCLVLNLLPSS